MKDEVYPPFFVLEIETDDFKFIDSVDELRLFVEEFWDILQEDFKIWDRNGFLLSFNQSFLEKSSTGIIRGSESELNMVKLKLLDFASKRNISIEDREATTLKDIYDVVVRYEK